MKANNSTTVGRMALKLAVVATGLRYWQVAEQANAILPEEQRLTEQAMVRLCTRRKRPSKMQAEAIAQILNYEVSELFQGIRADGTKLNRCSQCGQFVGEQWGATDSGRMRKRADSLLCERCTRKSLLPDEGGQS